MYISIDWIRDFVELSQTLTPEQIGQRFTLGTAEIEGIEAKGQYLSQVTVVEVVEVNPHPDADKLRIVSFKLGNGELKKVVCGAPNVRVNMRTFFAPNGTTLPIGFTLEPKKIRGVLSEGMLCSKEELGLAESSEGILDLEEGVSLGQTLGDYLNQRSDIILDVDNKSLTHRPDLWGHFGLAREFATLFETKLQNRFDENWQKKLEAKFTQEASPIKPQIVGESSCLAYYGLSLDNVKVVQSPGWLKQRLLAVGLRPINNIVDISNYVMMELGHPLHIFDRDRIDGAEIKIHRMTGDREFVTLDEQVRVLKSSDTVISDQNKPLVLAGIMGGEF